MLAINGTGGLCMTCNNAPGCYHHANRGPALFCELFDDYVPSFTQSGVEQDPRQLDRAMAVQTVQVHSGTHTGLCMNCAHREACAHPKLEGGIWHCENYE